MQRLVDECGALSKKNGELEDKNSRLTKKYEAVEEERDDWKKKWQTELDYN